MSSIPHNPVEAIDWLRQEPATDDRRGTCTDAVLLLARSNLVELRARVAELEKALAERGTCLQENAARYRWLRDRLNVTFDKADMDPQLVWLDAGMLDDNEWQRAVDEAIDRARTAPMKEGSR